MTDSSAASKHFKVQVDGQTPESWSEVLAQFDDASLYQTWAYGAERWGAANVSHLVLRQGDEIKAAAQLRIARVPLLPAGVAYLRWGPMCRRKNGTFEPGTLRQMLAALREEYAKRRGLSLQIIPNVFASDRDANAFLESLAAEKLTSDPAGAHYKTVIVDLTPAPEVMRKDLDQKWRNQLNRSEKNGLTVEVSDDNAAYGEFLKLYRVMWEKKQFDTSVDVEEFGRIQQRLSGKEKMQTFVARKDGQPVGALVCSLLGDTALYVLGATNDSARELKAAYFLHWRAMLWLRDHGARRYDLGGIDPIANPGGYHFKSGFGGIEVVQLSSHSGSSSTFGKLVLAGISWLRRRKAPSTKNAASTR